MWESFNRQRNSWVSYIIGGIVFFVAYLILHFLIFHGYGKVDYYSLSFSERKCENILFAIKFMGILFFCFGILRYIMYSISIYKNKRILLKIEDDLNNFDYVYSDNLKIYITRNYVLEFMNKISIYNISDILWIYPKKNIHKSRNGMTTGISYTIEFMLKDGKFFPFMSYLYRGYKEEEMEKVNELIEFIRDNNSNVKINYNDENIKYFKDKGFRLH